MEEKTHPKIEYKQEQINPHVYQTDNLTEKKINSDNLSIKHNTYSDYTPCYCCWVTSVVSDPVQPHRRQPTRLPRPWDSPGKNTVAGCHFLLQCMKGKRESEVAQSCPTLSDPMDCSLSGSSIHGIFQGRVLEWIAIAFSRILYFFPSGH